MPAVGPRVASQLRVAVVGARFWEGLSVRRHSLGDMGQPSDFMDQLKHDRSKTVGGLAVGPVPLSEQVAARRAEHFEQMEESRQAFIAVFGHAALAGGVIATRSYRGLGTSQRGHPPKGSLRRPGTQAATFSPVDATRNDDETDEPDTPPPPPPLPPRPGKRAAQTAASGAAKSRRSQRPSRQ